MIHKEPVVGAFLFTTPLIITTMARYRGKITRITEGTIFYDGDAGDSTHTKKNQFMFCVDTEQERDFFKKVISVAADARYAFHKKQEETFEAMLNGKLP